MFAKIKYSNFIDAVKLQMNVPKNSVVKAVLKDDSGFVCSSFEKNLTRDFQELIWSDLNHLPYGRYTIEVSQGDDELKMNLVKRVWNARNHSARLNYFM